MEKAELKIITKLPSYMRIIILYGFLLLELSSCIQEPKPKTFWEEEKLKGKVKSICSRNYEVKEKFGEIIKGEALTKSFSYCRYFNKKGYLIEQKGFDYEGKLDIKILYDVDKENNFTTGFTSYDEKDILISKVKYEPNKDLLIEKVISYNKDSEVRYSQLYFYDENGNNIKQIHYDSEGESEFIYVYDKYNFLIESIYSVNKMKKVRNRFVNDVNGHIKEHRIFDENDAIIMHRVFEREIDKMGNAIKVIMFENDKPVNYEELYIEYYE